MDDEDLISNLPDEILTHILSFFRTKFAVATCVLSKRWKLLWISVPNLEFDFFVRSSNSTTYEERKVHYENFIDRVLSFNKVMSVRNVKLDCCRTDVLRANAWFKSLAMRGAEKIDICFPQLYLVKGSLSSSTYLNFFPDSFFNQKILVELKLCDFVLKVPPLVCFPCLKTIQFQLVRFSDEESMKNLLSGCPVLTNLCISKWKCLNILTLYVRSSTLQELNLYTYLSDDPKSKVVIDAPKLAFLNLEGERGSAIYDVINMSSLVSASLSYVTDVEPIFELLRKISHVKELFLNRSILRLFENAALQKLPMFYSLIHLKLEIHRKPSLTVWPRLLEYTPNVVNIILKLNNPRRLWHVQLNLPQSILSSIERIEITEESRQSMPVISCILRNATALKKLSFHGLPIRSVQEDSFLKTFLTESQIKYASVRSY